MKKFILILLICMNLTNIQAVEQQPEYKIIANSNQQDDLDQMYNIKNKLLRDYRNWARGVNQVDQVLIDHCHQYDATYKEGLYLIVLGKGKGKSIQGPLKVSYCISSKDIKKKSIIQSLFSSK
ncbi:MULTISPECIES: hypothetical protein [Coprobacillaceae]|uniref:hypothetical protein n=1 Tax=Coprobacillaceae TaxID=2810280 RepID=UPI000E50B398|nr:MULTISPECIES: hypothetical protein [Coprobacillaceae]RHM61861.1 hypothetical protein DWZ53_03985 [Coprobacillus sp. AF33-1AC]RHS94712.1 hypothetical protein DW911_04285 [Erysipelatoclostridium sp. AM42-17]